MVTTPLPSAAPVERLVPSWFASLDVRVDDPVGADAIGLPVLAGGDVPADLGTDLAALTRAGFTPTVGSALAEPRRDGPALVAVGLGEAAALTAAGLRDAAAAFARAVPRDGALAFVLPSSDAVGPGEAAAAVVSSNSEAATSRADRAAASNSSVAAAPRIATAAIPRPTPPSWGV